MLNFYPVLWAEDIPAAVQQALRISIQPTYLRWTETWLVPVGSGGCVSEIVHERQKTPLTREDLWSAGYVLTAKRVYRWGRYYAGEIGTWMTPAEAIALVNQSKGAVRYVSKRQFVWVEHPNNPHSKPCTYEKEKA